MIGIRIDLPVWGKFVDSRRQKFREKLRSLGRINPELRRDCAHLVRPYDLADLIRRDGLVFAGADPGRGFIAVAGLREFVQEALEPATLGEESGQNAEERVGAARILAGVGLSAEN
jgi:hypothetical protein